MSRVHLNDEFVIKTLCAKFGCLDVSFSLTLILLHDVSRLLLGPTIRTNMANDGPVPRRSHSIRCWLSVLSAFAIPLCLLIAFVTYCVHDIAETLDPRIPCGSEVSSAFCFIFCNCANDRSLNLQTLWSGLPTRLAAGPLLNTCSLGAGGSASQES